MENKFEEIEETYTNVQKIERKDLDDRNNHVGIGTRILDEYDNMNMENKRLKKDPNFIKEKNNYKELLLDIEKIKEECKKLNLFLENRKINKRDIFDSASEDFKETVTPYIYKNTLNYYQRINYLEKKLQRLMKFLDKNENEIEKEFFDKIKNERIQISIFQEEFKKKLSKDVEDLKKKYFYEEENLKNNIFDLSNQNEKLIKNLCEREKTLKNKKTEFFNNLKENEENLNMAYKNKKLESMKNIEKNYITRIKNLENQIELERNAINCINKEIGIEKDQVDIEILKEFQKVINDKNNKEKEIIENGMNKNFVVIKNQKDIVEQKILNFEGKISEKNKEIQKKKKLKEQNIEEFFQKEFKVLSEKNKLLKIDLKNLEEKNKDIDSKNKNKITKYFEDKKRTLDVLMEKEKYKNSENPQNYNLLNNNITEKENELGNIRKKIDFMLKNSHFSEKKRLLINQVLNI